APQDPEGRRKVDPAPPSACRGAIHAGRHVHEKRKFFPRPTLEPKLHRLAATSPMAIRPSALLFVLPLLAFACSSAGDGSDSAQQDEPAPARDVRAIACNDGLDDVYARPADVASPSADRRGEIVACATDRSIARPELDSAARAVGYAGPPLAS